MYRERVQSFSDYVNSNINEDHKYRDLIIFFGEYSNVSRVQTLNNLFSVPIEKLYTLGIHEKKHWFKKLKLNKEPSDPEERRTFKELAFLKSHKLKQQVDYSQITSLNARGTSITITHKLSFACCINLLSKKYKKQQLADIIKEMSDIYNCYILYYDDFYTTKIRSMNNTIKGYTEDLKNIIHNSQLHSNKSNQLFTTPETNHRWSTISYEEPNEPQSYMTNIYDDNRLSDSFNPCSEASSLISNIPELERISLINEEEDIIESSSDKSVRLSTHAELMSNVNSQIISILDELKQGEFNIPSYDRDSNVSNQSSDTTVTKLFNLHHDLKR